MEKVWNEYSLKLFERVQRNDTNLLVAAGAGTGKTTNLIEIVKYLPKNAKVGFFSFGKAIVEELKVRLAEFSNCEPYTFHSFGAKAINKNMRRKFNNNYVHWIVKNLTDEKWTKELQAVRNALSKLVSLSKATLVDVNDFNAVESMAIKYGVDVNGNFERVVNLLPSVMKQSLEAYYFDYDDMLFIPVVKKLKMPQYDFILTDETQDNSPVQNEMLAMIFKDRLIAVGDSKQSIYGFRGADTKSMQKVQEKFNCEVMVLPVTYRCPVAHVELINKLFPDYPFFAAPNAIEGTIADIEYSKVIERAKNDDMILCRKNAPLVSLAFAIIRTGKKAVIRGRDIGSNLVSLIDKLEPTDLNDLYAKLREYEFKESERFKAKNNETGLQNLIDKIETIRAIADEVENLSLLKLKIEEIFTDNITGVVLSSIHRAKGLEASTVFILEPENLPMPQVLKRGTAEEIEQEYNVKLVALTRSKNEMFFIVKDKKQIELN